MALNMQIELERECLYIVIIMIVIIRERKHIESVIKSYR